MTLGVMPIEIILRFEVKFTVVVKELRPEVFYSLVIPYVIYVVEDVTLAARYRLFVRIKMDLTFVLRQNIKLRFECFVAFFTLVIVDNHLYV